MVQLDADAVGQLRGPAHVAEEEQISHSRTARTAVPLTQAAVRNQADTCAPHQGQQSRGVIALSTAGQLGWPPLGSFSCR